MDGVQIKLEMCWRPALPSTDSEHQKLPSSRVDDQLLTRCKHLELNSYGRRPYGILPLDSHTLQASGLDYLSFSVVSSDYPDVHSYSKNREIHYSFGRVRMIYNACTYSLPLFLHMSYIRKAMYRGWVCHHPKISGRRYSMSVTQQCATVGKVG
ncbi:hypothetical protein BDQ17DRAFT_1357356 [Cyathus striatus]|nr:hypothetical protein BDQ17DRAFT_1357356 [Cyathus striatus]